MFLRNLTIAIAQLIGTQIQRVKDTVQLMLNAGPVNQEPTTQAGNNSFVPPLGIHLAHLQVLQNSELAQPTTQVAKRGRKPRRALAEPTDNHSKEVGQEFPAPAPQTRRPVGRPRKVKA